MAIKRLTQRVIYVAKCACGWSDTRVDNPPRESQCTACKTWHPFAEQTWTGPDTFDKK